MRYALTLMAALLLTTAQVPGPVGDMSNSTTKATGTTAARKLADRAADWIDPGDFGAIGDGSSHPLSSRYSTLAAAQVVCSQATDLTQEIDWCAMQAAINFIASHPNLTAIGVNGTPGGSIRISSGTTLKLGTTPLVANLVGLAIVGEDQWSSAILVGANPMLDFGRSNGMGTQSAVPAGGGVAFATGDTITLTGAGGTCNTLPVVAVTNVGDIGQIVSTSVATSVGGNAGDCPVTPTNPVDFSTTGIGYGAQFNANWSGNQLTSLTPLARTGTGCVVGDILTAVGGSTILGTVRPFVVKVVNASAGAVLGAVVTDTGSYGTPPVNPVTTTAASGSGCTGATFNIGRMTNWGGALKLQNLQFIADGPGVSVVTAQFNLPNESTNFDHLLLYASNTNAWFDHGFDLTSITNSKFSNIDSHNSLTYFNTNPSGPLFTIRSQNTLFGHFGHYWNIVNAYAFTGGLIDYITNAAETVPFQGLYFHDVGCALGAHCVRMENAGIHGYGDVIIDNLYSTQTIQQLEITRGLAITIANSGFGQGTNRMTTQPASADMVVLDSVNQFFLRNNWCGAALTAIPTITCFHIVGTSGFGTISNNIIMNAVKLPSLTGIVFDSGTSSNREINNYFGANVTPVVDNGTKNTTSLSPPPATPCVTHTLANGETYTMPDYTGCMYFNNGLISGATVIMPANNQPWQTIQFTSFGTTTTLTLQANTGQVMGGSMPTTITPAAPFSLKNVGGRWQKV